MRSPTTGRWPGLRRKCSALLLGGIFLAAPASSPLAQEPQKKEQPIEIPTAPRGKKLILKDGSFHLVRSYERKGDRVRYYSVERSAWEELPADMVDWEATRKAEEEQNQREAEQREKVVASEQKARAEEVDVDASIEVAPGQFLPEGEGMWVWDGKMFTPLSQVGADPKLDKKRLLGQIFVPVPIIPTRHRIQIAGKKAELRLTTAQPEFYFRTADQREPEIQLIRVRVKGNVREVQVVDTNLVGEQNAKAQIVAMQRWKAARGVYRLTLGESLEPGEYVLAEYISSDPQSSEPATTMNLYVWDFGVDAVTPARHGGPPPPAPQKRP